MKEKDIGKFIQQKRKEKNLTQQELGAKLFVTDKAVSKWERGLSLPDITLLGKLADILEVDIYDLLQIENKSQQINIEAILEAEQKKIKKSNRKKLIKLLIPIIIVIIFLSWLVFKNVYVGYELKEVSYNSEKNIKIGTPKLSFMMKQNDRSYSFKNFRSAHVLESEIKKYFKSLSNLTCNNTLYYYDEENDVSYINYDVKDHILYSTISYEIADGDYCYQEKLSDYSQKLGGLKRYHTLNGGTFHPEKEQGNKLEILFLDGGDTSDGNYHFEATMKVIYYQQQNNTTTSQILEESKGDFEIKDNQLIYYRTEIIEASDIMIPKTSTFTIENHTLKLDDNYLRDYQENIILK